MEEFGIGVSFFQTVVLASLLPIGSVLPNEQCEALLAQITQAVFSCRQVSKLFEQVK